MCGATVGASIAPATGRRATPSVPYRRFCFRPVLDSLRDRRGTGQSCSCEVMERETGIEPATFSLGRRQSIGNKEHSVSCISFWRLRIPAFQSFLCTRIKRSTNGAHESSRDTSRAFTFSTPLWFPLSSTAIASSALMLIAARLRHVAATKWGTKRYLQMNRSNKTVGPHLGRGAANGSMKFSS